MLIFYRQDSDAGTVTPIVLIDALRSDDRFGTEEIKLLAAVGMPTKLRGRPLNAADVYSVEYDATYSVNGVNPGDSWRTRFYGMVKNPPGKLVSLFSPQYFVSQESMEALTAVIQRVVNPQRTIVYALMLVRGLKGVVARPFIAYAAPHTPLPGSTDTKLTINGAGFDDAIITTKKAVRIDTKTPLKSQLEKYLAPAKCVFKTADAERKPISEIFRPAMPLNELLGEICTQNQLAFMQEGDAFLFYDTRLKGAPKEPATLSAGFLGSEPIMCYNFALSDYTLGQFSTDVFDIKLFSSIAIRNDIKNAIFSGLNKAPSPPAKKASLLSSALSAITSGGASATTDKYNFFILAYDLIDGRETKQLKVTATNNWIVSQSKVAALLENQVYKDALAK